MGSVFGWVVRERFLEEVIFDFRFFWWKGVLLRLGEEYFNKDNRFELGRG